MPFQGNRNRVSKQQNVNLGGPSLLLGRTSFSGMFKVVMSEPPFQNQPYSLGLFLFLDHQGSNWLMLGNPSFGIDVWIDFEWICDAFGFNLLTLLHNLWCVVLHLEVVFSSIDFALFWDRLLVVHLIFTEDSLQKTRIRRFRNCCDVLNDFQSI